MFARSLTTREELIRALHTSAELEHAVMCQYLFAAFTMKRSPSEGGASLVQLERMREWQATLLLVARQEMEHLGLVWNLLTAVGGTPHFRRHVFPSRAGVRASIPPHALEPFSLAAVARFMQIEKSHSLSGAADGGAGADHTIGDAYERILRGLEYLHGATRTPFIGPRKAQVVNASVDLRPGQYDVQLSAIYDLETARQAIDRIVESSELPPEQNAESHFARFKRLYDELSIMQYEDPGFVPGRQVGANPITRMHGHAPADEDADIPADAGAETIADTTFIDHPVSRRAAFLFNDAYETMLLMLVRFYAPAEETPADRAGLKRIIFFPMMTMVMRPLGEVLTRMPAHPDGTHVCAGPTFEIRAEAGLPPDRESAWIRLNDRLQQLVASCEELNAAMDAEDTPWADDVRPRLRFLHENLAAMMANFGRYMNMTELQHRRLLHVVLGAR